MSATVDPNAVEAATPEQPSAGIYKALPLWTDILTPAQMANLLIKQHGALRDLSALFDEMLPEYAESTVAANARAAIAKVGA